MSLKRQCDSLSTKSRLIKRPNLSKSEFSSSWKALPELIFNDIMMMLGLKSFYFLKESLEDLNKCRQVCQSWNVTISQMTRYHKDFLRRKAETLAVEIREDWLPFPYGLDLRDIISAASFAYHGMLGSSLYFRLMDVDLTSVPAEHLASLIACVTDHFDIENVIGLMNILNNIKSNVRAISISNQSLSSEETRALVRAMESNVEIVILGDEEVTLDIGILTQYSGQGRCGVVECFDDTADRYREDVRSWAQRINWSVTRNQKDGLWSELQVQKKEDI